MGKLIKSILFICFSIGICTSCSSKFHVQAYDYNSFARLSIDSLRNLALKGDIPWEEKSIVMISDTTLNYFKRIGGLGYLNTIGYKRLDNILLIDSVDEYIINPNDQITREIIGKSFFYTKDSLVEIETNQLYLNRRHNKSSRIKNNKEGYIIIHE